MAHVRVAIVSEPLDITSEMERVTAGRGDIGAVVTFTGLCRDEDGRLEALELEHYPGMAEAEVTRIAEQAAGRWDISDVTILHRHGKVKPGEVIVLVVTASKHRHAAFESAAFIMDFLKTHAPFWKKEHTAAGAVNWVSAKRSDDDAEERWKTAD
ncbi:molybdenum cofactor biosynthesis protein MoaE [Kaistia terrae]|jgi:molybdopterin synthase catalytic subunit|uniref:Molybdopterin synthase catalytic subunit n=1 Tax=Kaistia terrae TaxID=537017 RepID=A0ABW0PTX0_9HYPH|nr:molybdenum cofactor biosynthesis protein MoaE [Kaistia terrae]MCX5576992.1 molybdenum cofactor biosynthesis protein MoaE [Kaistia terrae]